MSAATSAGAASMSGAASASTAIPPMPPLPQAAAFASAFAPIGPVMPMTPMTPMAPVGLPPDKLAQLQQEYLNRCQQLLQSAGNGQAPGISDKRFSDPSWQSNPAYSWGAAIYLLNAEFLNRMAEAVDGDSHTRDRIRFAVSQWVDALSPANYLATNPEAQKLIVETQGKSLVSGTENLMSDLQRGRISMTDESAFEVGRNVATSKGEVVFQNELIQLIQYAPSTPSVHAMPLLMVPPCINKFYILDLQPDNSMVAYAVSQGYTVFMLSWRNVHEDQGSLTWDDYLATGAVKAIEVAQQISGSKQINVLGFCVGGTIIATALAALAAQGRNPVASLTLMTTLLDFEEPGVLGVFIDETQVAMREQSIGKGGLLRGQELATTFSFLRPNDLVWNYVVNNYLKGRAPAAFDLLYWNSDATNLPGPMFVWYLRHMYLQNELRIPGRLQSLGVPVDLGRIKVPTFVFAAREDHIVPWRAAFRNNKLVGGPVRFVLGASGHIAGAINPVSKNKRSYWVGDRHLDDPDAWFAAAAEQPGSWWADWSRWMAALQHGPMRPAPAGFGSGEHEPIEPAPGSYVKQRAD